MGSMKTSQEIVEARKLIVESMDRLSDSPRQHDQMTGAIRALGWVLDIVNEDTEKLTVSLIKLKRALTEVTI